MDFNHYISIPEGRSCYVDNVDYGRFDFYLSKYSNVAVTYDAYVYEDGVCQLSETGVTMEPGAKGGDAYC